MIAAFKTVGPADVLDMLLVAGFIYALLVWFKRTKSAFVALGLMVLAAVYTLARAAGLIMTTWIFQGFFAVLIVAIIVIFQEEIRSIFERIAVWSLGGSAQPSAQEREVEMLVRAVADFARDGTGALVVLRGRDPLDRHVEGGWELNGLLSEALLESIFDSHSLGHDGAVIVERDRVVKFGCHLPLSKEFGKINNVGTRHTAALGLSELTDALSLVVSEERGTISIARRGNLEVIQSLAKLEDTLQNFFLEVAPRPAGESFLQVWRHNTKEKAIAAALSILFWSLFVGGVGSR
jgi:diadenylate cyclase